jgi:RNA polymerase sigma-70 factor, ECF subfamily
MTGMIRMSGGAKMTIDGEVPRRAAEETTSEARPSFESFCAVRREALYHLVLRIVGSPDAAHDVVQDVMVQALRHWRGIDDPEAWCRVAAVRKSYNCLRSRKRFGPMPSEGQADSGARDERLLERIAVERALSGLKPEARTLLALALGEGWSYREIAEALQIPEGTVGSRLNKAKEQFRRRFEEYP